MKLSLLRIGVLGLLLTVLSSAASYAQLNVTITVSNPTCNGFTNGTATAIASGGDGSYQYSWSNGQSGQTTFGLGAGQVSVTVTDGQGNTGTRSATIQAPSALSGTITQASGCPASSTATVNVSGGTAPYTYLWSNGQTSATATGLSFSTACVTVTDAAGCAEIICQTLNAPLAVTLTTQDPLCAGGCDAVVIATVSGGIQPISYQWDNGFTGAINDMLLAGTYCVTVTDGAGCTVDACATVGQPNGYNITFSSVNPDCGGTNGSTTASATGGTPPYTYTWNTGASGPSISGLAEGTYTVTVTDANGCSDSESVTLSGSNLIVDATGVSPACGPGATGSATATVSGGTPPFQYQWSSGSTTATAGNLAPGTYTVTVTDANFCTGTASVTLNAGSSLTVTATSTNELCAGANDGSASVNVSGGQAPFTYAWSNGATDPTIDNLAPGTYSVMVTDNAGCTGSANNIVVAAASALNCSVTILDEISIQGANDGRLTAQFMGGVAPFSVSWNTGATTQTISNLGPGTYTATITDGNGCTTTCSQTLVDPVTILGKIGDFVFRDLNRNGQQDAGEPGVNGVRVRLIFPNGTRSPFITTGTDGMYCFTDLVPGDYQVEFEIRQGDDVFTVANTGNDDTDSDAVPTSSPQIGVSQVVTIGSGDTVLTVDAGIYDACVPVDPGMISIEDNTVCGVGAIPGLITSSSPATSTAAIRYLWMFNDNNDPNINNWTVAPGVNNTATYQPGPIAEPTYFARCAFGLNCSTPVESNKILITPGSDARAEISGPTSVCEDDPYTFTAVAPGGGAQILWDFGPNATPRTSTNATVSVTWAVFGQRVVSLRVIRNGCETFDTQLVTVSNCFSPRAFPLKTRLTAASTVELQWALPEDLEEGTYRVERSINGGVSYSPIGTVDVEISTLRKVYNFTDANPKRGYNMYRVCRVLDKGDTYFSEEATASFLTEKVEIFAYPNPIVDQVTIERFEMIDENRTVELVDQSGRVIQTVTFPAGERMIYLDLSNTPIGQLHVRMVSPEGIIGSVTILKQ